MLLSGQKQRVAADLISEVRGRPEIKAIVPEQLLENEHFWHMLLDVLEYAVHENGYVIAPKTAISVRVQGRRAVTRSRCA
jgi:hypothetical protein